MAATPSVKVVKSMTFKATTRLWSNRYHFVGGVPADASHWNALFDAITAAEKAIFHNNIQLVHAYGYAAGSDVPVADKAYTLAGTYNPTTAERAPGECAALVRFTTDIRTAKNHPVYLFNYYHGVLLNVGVADTVETGQKAAMTSYAGAWITGFSDGTNTYNRAGPNGAVALTGACETYITHRDFPRA